jgi:hypothetical protein
MKISKSAGNAFDVDETVAEIGGSYAVDGFSSFAFSFTLICF